MTIKIHLKSLNNQFTWFALIALLAVFPVFVTDPGLLETIELFIVVIATSFVTKYFGSKRTPQ